eukprot:gene1016-9921_t
MDFLLSQVSQVVSYFRTPTYEGTMNIDGISSDVEIIRDTYGVPHIFAKTENDCIFAQGFVHAQERLWQMEALRRLAFGELAELVPEALKSDRMSRTLGYKRLGIEDVKNLSKEMSSALQAYCDGVNHYINSNYYQTPVEFTLLGINPPKWTPEISCSISRLLAFMMSRGWYLQVINMAVSEKMKENLSDFKYDHHPSHIEEISINILNVEEIVKTSNQEQGSNSWAISPELTKGKPILASDPHLAVSNPSIWFENHLETSDLKSFGVSIPGTPYVIIGHNSSFAWGVTLTYGDVSDIFIEKTKENKYEFKNEWKDLKIIKEIIKVKGQSDIIENVRITHHGPIISGITNFTKDNQMEFSLSAPYLQSRDTDYFEYIRQLSFGKNWDDFVTICTGLDLYTLNVTYSDIHGNIGYYMTGKFPIRTEESIKLANYPKPGFDGSCEWNGFIPRNELPHVLNPKLGYVVSANHNIVDPKVNYKHFIGKCFKAGYRADRITELLQKIFKEKGKVTVSDCKEMQMDEMDNSDISKFLGNLKLDLDSLYKKSNQKEISLSHIKEVVKQFQEWDGIANIKSIGACISIVFTNICAKNCLKTNFGEELVKSVLGCGFSPNSVSEFHSHESEVLIYLLNEMKNEQRDDIIFDSIIETIKKIRELIKLDESERVGELEVIHYEYGKIHQLTFKHAFGSKISEFNRGPYPIGGTANSINAQAHIPHGDNYDVVIIPSYRMVVDLNDFDKSYSIYGPGQSGNEQSKHYDDLIPMFLKGEYKPMFWSKDLILKNSEAILKFEKVQ